jgi:hypothetical protein
MPTCCIQRHARAAAQRGRPAPDEHRMRPRSTKPGRRAPAVQQRQVREQRERGRERHARAPFTAQHCVCALHPTCSLRPSLSLQPHYALQDEWGPERHVVPCRTMSWRTCADF